MRDGVSVHVRSLDPILSRFLLACDRIQDCLSLFQPQNHFRLNHTQRQERTLGRYFYHG